jgi:hypothetical protein
MLKIVTAGLTALLITTSPLAYAQAPSADEGRLTAADLAKLTDMRVDIVKAALQLTSDQEKLWPPVEDAIRNRANDRQARLVEMAQRAAERREANPVEVVRNRDPIDFLHRRADALSQRADDLRKLADAWGPLYQTLNPDQKQRMAFLAVFVVHELSERSEQRAQYGDDEED